MLNLENVMRKRAKDSANVRRGLADKVGLKFSTIKRPVFRPTALYVVVSAYEPATYLPTPIRLVQ